MTGSSDSYIDPGKANSPSMMVIAQSFQEYYLRLFSILDPDYTVPLAQKKQTQEQIHCHQNNGSKWSVFMALFLAILEFLLFMQSQINT